MTKSNTSSIVIFSLESCSTYTLSSIKTIDSGYITVYPKEYKKRNKLKKINDDF
jgi:hypothetical protein